MTTRFVADDETLKYIAELERDNMAMMTGHALQLSRIATLEQQNAKLLSALESIRAASSAGDWPDEFAILDKVKQQ